MSEEKELTGSQIIAQYFKNSGIRHVFGIPGHGNAAFIDVLKDYGPDVEFVPIKHEQWGGHMADGYFRAQRKIPAAVTTSVGPGATNLATALATAYVDSSSFIAITGQVQTYFFGMGIFQEIERQNWVDYVNVMKHLTKRAWLVTNLRQLPRVMLDAHKTAITGRPGPVLVDFPMDLQVMKLKTSVPSYLKTMLENSRAYPDPSSIRRAAQLLINSERPLILIGGGVAMSDASNELLQVAELLGAPVAASFRGDAKGGFPEDHELYVFHPGNVGSPVANKIGLEADVILAVGVTFSDETTSSYRKDVTFNIPPTKLIHIDIDSHEVGKNYPTEVGIVADAKIALQELFQELSRQGRKGDYRKSSYFEQVKKLKEDWWHELESMRSKTPMGIPNVVKLMRGVLPRDAIVAASAGLPQEIMSQLWISYFPNTFISSGGFSTMGFALPAIMGAKLAQPKRVAVAVEGDGSFLMNSVELLTAAQLKLPIVTVILNNYGWISIRDLQMRNFGGRIIGTEFRGKDGSQIVPDFQKLVTSYNVDYFRAETPEEVSKTVSSAIRVEGPAVVEVVVENRFPNAGPKAYGYWDLPSRVT